MSDHLIFARQTYFEHFLDSIKFSGLAFKACYYFTVHAIFPEYYITNGSRTISKLHDIINLKYEIL